MPSTIKWDGVPPSRALSQALNDARLTIDRGQVAGASGPLVLCTSSGRPPAASRAESRWIWVSTSPISTAQALEAVKRGAYAAVSLSAADAPAKLVARLQELSTPRTA